MLNVRKIDRFYLGGGWQNISMGDYNFIPSDIRMLIGKQIGFVLDVQFTPIDEVNNELSVILARENIGYKRVEMYDGEYNKDFGKILDDTAALLAEAEATLPVKKNILVKCSVGVSRSAAVLINYLCVSRRMSFDEALNYVRTQEKKNANYTLGVMIDSSFVRELRRRYPETVSAFGERE